MMRSILLFLAVACSGPTLACAPEVEAVKGDIVFHDCSGPDKIIATGGNFVDPALSPDDKKIAYIKVEVEGTPSYGDSRTSLWIADVAAGRSRLLLASTPAEGMTETLAAIWKPEFSLGGGYVYVESEAWVTSPAIHQVAVKTGHHKYVTDGVLLFVIRSGKYAGYLMVQKHKYHKNPELGAYDPVYVVRPDGKWSMLVPGSDKDSGESGSVETWMKKNAK